MQVPGGQGLRIGKALVMGTEGEGLPKVILKRFHTARIAQMPGLDSLNVGTASGIALYSLAKSMGRLRS